MKAPDGMVVNKDAHTAELVYAGQEIEITETAASFCNDRQKARISLSKVLEQNKQFGIGIPQEVMLAFNAGNTAKDVNLDLFLGDGTNAIIENLDEQAMRSIRTMIMVEYARCTSTPGEVIVKSFDGMNFNVPVAPNAKTKEAYRAIKEIKQTHEE